MQLDPSALFSRRTGRLRSSAIRDLLKLTESRDVLSLAGGLPSPDSFPLDDLRREADRLLGEFGPSVVQYSATDGVPVLRNWIAGYHAESFGRPVDPDGEILVTHGSQQALDLIAKAFIDEGDVVVTESPAYLGAIQSLELFGPQFAVVPGDEHGMLVDNLADQLSAGLRPKIVYVVANFHNPSGATLSFERRSRLAELAEQFNFFIVEDDPYGAIRFAGSPVAPIASMSDRVIHLSTFSKIVAPGFRVGWIVAPPSVIAMLARAKQAADLHTSTFAQTLLANVVARPGWLTEQQARIVPIYRDRCTALADAFVDHLGDAIEFHRPEGGMFLWARFPGLTNTDELLQDCIREGVAFVPGGAFTIDQVPNNNARFSFSTLDPKHLQIAAERVARAVQSRSVLAE